MTTTPVADNPVASDGVADLASSILVMLNFVRAQLSAQTPMVGYVDSQARAAFDSNLHMWRVLTRPAALRIARRAARGAAEGDVKRIAHDYQANLATVVFEPAARALAAGMNAQLAQKWDPSVAWQRALVAYGVDGPTMRQFIAMATQGTDGLASAVIPPRARRSAETKLLSHAGQIAEREFAAADSAGVGVAKKAEPERIAGLALRAKDTGRILMLQRALDDDDPAAGMWEFPGGHVETGETPLTGAEREWREEVGRQLPGARTRAGQWQHGPYTGFVVETERESDVPIGRGRGTVVNPDDPDGDAIEQLAWWDPEQMKSNPALRGELRESMGKVQRALGSVRKAFDFTSAELSRWAKKQPRDESGRFSSTGSKTAGASGPTGSKTGSAGRKKGHVRPNVKLGPIKLKTGPALKESQRDELDRLLSGMAVSPDEEDRYTQAQRDRYAQARRDRYAEIDRYAQAQGDRYEQAERNERYAAKTDEQTDAAREARYAAAGDARYADAQRKQPKIIRRTAYIFTPVKAPEGPPPKETDASGYSFYLPLGDIAAYYYDHSTDMGHADPTARSTVDFQRIANYYDDVDKGSLRIEAVEARNPWDLVEGVDVDPDEWHALLDKAIPLWNEVQDDPVGAAENLDGQKLSEISARAGFPPSGTGHIRDQIAQDAADRDNGESFDPSLLDALADYVVWNDPESLGEKGRAFGDELEEVANRDEIDESPVPAVLSFSSGMQGDDDAADLRGRYGVLHIEYHSPIGEFGHSAPPGKLGLREIFIEPKN